MIAKKLLKNRIKKAIFGCFFGILGLILPLFANSAAVYAAPDDGGNETTAETLTCDDHLGSLGWLVCPTTGKISEAVDWLYDKNQELLDVNPVQATDDSPIYLIWKYFLGVANVAFIIFLLVIVYSQITGVGISNYGVKKALPKLIIAAILVNLSFVICSLAVDVSNVIGNGTRGVFTSIEAQTVPEMLSEEHYADAETSVKMVDVYTTLAGGGSGAGVVGAAAFEGGEIWMFIPTVLGALVAVVVGLITIALRQVVVILLMMVAPLAIVAYILPNTENLFKKWKNLLVKMLVFYPAYSLLFGASSLAGWAIISSATNGFALILGIAVQIFPLFFSWSLMKMSGTFLGTINAKLTGFFATPLARNRAWAESHREQTRQKFLASDKVYSPTLKLRQYLSDRKIAREEETKEYAETVKLRGQAYATYRNYKSEDELNDEGKQAYDMQARNMQYQRRILRHKNNMEKGFAERYARVHSDIPNVEKTPEYKRLLALDMKNVEASDLLKAEATRGEKIDIDNAIGYHKRMDDALNAHMYELHHNDVDAETGLPIYKNTFKNERERLSSLDRYNAMKSVMEGNLQDTQYIVASAAHSYDAQKKVYETKMKQLFDYTVPTKEVERRLEELTKDADIVKNIDAAIAGLRVLNQRGDTDLMREQIENILEDEKGNPRIKLGTHASQALASFLMFEVKDSDPFLRRFGKYINLETAQVFNKRNRINDELTLDEYVTGEYNEVDSAGNFVEIKKSKRDMTVLTEGTSLDNIERTAMKNLDDMLKNAYTKDGKLDVKAYLDRREKVETAIGPAFISASLKHLSGSEQLKSMVSFLTGIDGKGKARWEENGDLAVDDESKELAEKYFRRKTLQYFKDQTPAQILGLRSDYKAPVAEHLFADYFDDDSEWNKGLSPEERQERSNRMGEFAKTESEYNRIMGSNVSKDVKDEYKKKYMDAKNELIGDHLRNILRKTGKLEQIYRTRRSGAANNAKDWLRGWLSLDDEISITKELEANKEKRKKEYEEEERRRREADPNYESSFDEMAGGFTGADRLSFAADIDSLRDDYRGEDPSEFYKACLKHIDESEYRHVSDKIKKEFQDYYEHHEYADNHDLAEALIDILKNPDNY